LRCPTPMHSRAGPRPPPRFSLRMGALTVGTSSVVPRPTGQRPAAAPCVLSLTECDARRHTPFSPRDRRLVRQHDVRSAPRPARGRPNRLAAPRSTRRAMRRTDFCHLTSSYEHPRLVGSWLRKLACPGIRLLHGRAIHFGGAPALTGARASDTPVALLARGRGRRPERSRESMRFGTTTRSIFRRARTFAPRRSLERPAPAFPAPRLCHRDAGYRCRWTRASLVGFARAEPPSTRPVASGRRASLGP